MQSRNRGTFVWRGMVVALVIGGVLLSVFRISSAKPQSQIGLENRITQLEQRLFTVENTVRNVEQQARIGSMSSRGEGQEDVRLLHSQIETLQRRLIDDECALAKLDERTLPRETRETRRRSGAGSSDPCRSQVDTPVRLPN